MKTIIKPWMYEKICKEMNTYNSVPIAEEVEGGYAVEIKRILDHTAKAYKMDMCYYKKAYGDDIDMTVYHGWLCWIPISAISDGIR